MYLLVQKFPDEETFFSAICGYTKTKSAAKIFRRQIIQSNKEKLKTSRAQYDKNLSIAKAKVKDNFEAILGALLAIYPKDATALASWKALKENQNIDGAIEFYARNINIISSIDPILFKSLDFPEINWHNTLKEKFYPTKKKDIAIIKVNKLDKTINIGKKIRESRHTNE